MRVEYYSDKIVTYLINRKLNVNIDNIRNLLIDVLNNLIHNYNIDINNNYNINIYINNLYGIIVELINRESTDDVNNIELSILNDKLFLYEIDDPLNYIEDEIYYYKNKYYLNAKNMDIDLLENSKLVYDDKVYKILGRGIKI